MKLIHTFILLISLLSFSYGQSYTAVSPEKAIPSPTYSPLDEVAEQPGENSAFQQSQQAVKQLRNYLTQNIAYPEEMLKNGIEGRMIIKVTIAESGKILGSEIMKSPHYAFHKSAEKVMKKIKHIEVKGKQYNGVPVIYIPIDFSL